MRCCTVSNLQQLCSGSLVKQRFPASSHHKISLKANINFKEPNLVLKKPGFLSPTAAYLWKKDDLQQKYIKKRL